MQSLGIWLNSRNGHTGVLYKIPTAVRFVRKAIKVVSVLLCWL